VSILHDEKFLVYLNYTTYLVQSSKYISKFDCLFTTLVFSIKLNKISPKGVQFEQVEMKIFSTCTLYLVDLFSDIQC
jgi:hypothetical protein